MAEEEKSKAWFTKREIISGLVIGLVVSVVFVFIAEPLIKFVGRWVIEVIGSFSTSFIDSMYARVGEGLVERFAARVVSFVFPMYLTIFFVAAALGRRVRRDAERRIKDLESHPLLNESKEADLKASVEPALDEASVVADAKEEMRGLLSKCRRLRLAGIMGIWTGWGFIALATVLHGSTMYRSLYIHSAVIYIERSIEILAPAIDPNERLQLRADYRSIDSRKKFMALHQRLVSTAKAKGIEIPKFDPD